MREGGHDPLTRPSNPFLRPSPTLSPSPLLTSWRPCQWVSVAFLTCHSALSKQEELLSAYCHSGLQWAQQRWWSDDALGAVHTATGPDQVAWIKGAGQRFWWQGLKRLIIIHRVVPVFSWCIHRSKVYDIYGKFTDYKLLNWLIIVAYWCLTDFRDFFSIFLPVSPGPFFFTLYVKRITFLTIPFIHAFLRTNMYIYTINTMVEGNKINKWNNNK